MVNRKLQLLSLFLVTFFVLGTVRAQIIYKTAAEAGAAAGSSDMSLTSSNAWIPFLFAQVTPGREDYNNDFGLWYHDTGYFRLETYDKSVIGTEVNSVDGSGVEQSSKTANLTSLDKGTEIGPTSDWVATGNYPDEPYVISPTFTDWKGQTAYLGTECLIDGNIYYGWIQLSVSSDGSSVTLIDMAYNSVAGASISAGDKGENGVEQVKSKIPAEYTLNQNYPNPFNPSTKISYSIERPCKVRLMIYNYLGKKIKSLVDEYKRPGSYSVQWEANGLPSGIYICRLEANNVSIIRKMMLLK